MDKLKVAVLGATGMVGQRFIQLLQEHPYFELLELAASKRSAGKSYSRAAKWYLEGDIPGGVEDMEVREIEPQKLEADLAFSALPSGIAKEVEPSFAGEGFTVCSNASAYRMGRDVPLLIPEVNPHHLEMLEAQRENRGWEGAIITNPNCSTIMATLPLKPLFDKFGIESAFVSTLQALSGAGYSGVPSMAITDNVLPFIKGEEEKIETEPLKILGGVGGGEFNYEGFKITAHCTRVPVLDGHTEIISLKLEEDAGVEDVKSALRDFRGEPQKLKLPTAPHNPIMVREEEDRPQPRLDRGAGRGMAVSVGRVRDDPVADVKFVTMGHNTLRGAAGASVLNAELLVKKGMV